MNQNSQKRKETNRMKLNEKSRNKNENTQTIKKRPKTSKFQSKKTKCSKIKHTNQTENISKTFRNESSTMKTVQKQKSKTTTTDSCAISMILAYQLRSNLRTSSRRFYAGTVRADLLELGEGTRNTASSPLA